MEDTLKDILGKLNSMDAAIKDLKKHTIEIERDITDLKIHVVFMESNHRDKLDSLVDGYKLTSDKLQKYEQCLGRIEQKLEKQDVEIIKGVK